MEMGTDTGKTFQDRDQGVGVTTISATRGGLFQPDHEHTHLLHRGAGRRARGYDAGYDDVGDLHRGAALFAYRAIDRSLQDAKISLERLGEIHGKEDEEQAGGIRLNVLPDDRTLRLENLSFSYDGADRDYVLEDINLTIPHNRVTAIVGASGSGKTTIVKLLLGFYNPNKGDVRIGDTSLKNLNPHVWRSKTGSVMQDGFIFSDTIANNIAPGEEVVDKERLLHAVTVANIRDFIDSLPLGYNTKIGMEGNGVSQGQRQRILIARAVYKNPDFIFLDEATNALDANNEREIMEQLHAFYKGRTVVVVAHRLSTVRDADKIVVLDKGRVVEEGTHQELTALRGTYYKLVKNQLELGN